MILPSAIHIAKADEILPPPLSPREAANVAKDGAATVENRVIIRDAIVNKTDKMCATGKSNLQPPLSTFSFLHGCHVVS